MVGWRAMKQEEVDEFWMKIARTIEEEVLNKYKEACLQRERCALGMENCTKKQDIAAAQME